MQPKVNRERVEGTAVAGDPRGLFGKVGVDDAGEVTSVP